MQGTVPPPAYSSRATSPKIGEWLSEAFTLFQRELTTWLCQGGVFFAGAILPIFIGLGIYYVALFGSIAASGGSGSRSSGPPVAMLAGLGIGLGAMLLFTLIGSVMSVYLSLGMKHTAAKQLRGEPISVRDIFGAGSSIFTAIGIGFLFMVAYMLGLLLLIIPGIIVLFFFAARCGFALPLAIEKRLGPIDAIKESIEATAGAPWMWLLWFFIIQMIGSVGAYVFYIGMIASYPIFILALMISYRDTIGIPGALPPAVAQTAVPPPAYPTQNYGPAGPPSAAAPCPACGRPVALGAVRCPSCSTGFPEGFGAGRSAEAPLG